MKGVLSMLTVTSETQYPMKVVLELVKLALSSSKSLAETTS